MKLELRLTQLEFDQFKQLLIYAQASSDSDVEMIAKRISEKLGLIVLEGGNE